MLCKLIWCIYLVFGLCLVRIWCHTVCCCGICNTSSHVWLSALKLCLFLLKTPLFCWALQQVAVMLARCKNCSFVVQDPDVTYAPNPALFDIWHLASSCLFELHSCTDTSFIDHAENSSEVEPEVLDSLPALLIPHLLLLLRLNTPPCSSSGYRCGICNRPSHLWRLWGWSDLLAGSARSGFFQFSRFPQSHLQRLSFCLNKRCSW